MNADHKNDICKNNPNNSANKKTLKEALPWSKLGNVDVIKKWSEEIKLAVRQKSDADEWALVGHAVTIIHDDIEDCKNVLQRIAVDLDFEFACFDDDAISKSFTDEDAHIEFNGPTIVYLEPGEWMKPLEDESPSTTQNNICMEIQSFNPAKPVIYVTSTPDLDRFSPKFRKVGLFDRRFEIIKPTLEAIAESFLEALGAEIIGESLKSQLGKVGKLLDLDFDERRRKDLVVLALKRIAKNKNRKVEFADLLEISLQGSAEFDEYPVKTEAVLRHVAIHEAGHALVAMIDSNGENTPEFASIIESNAYNGVVADSLSYHYSKSHIKTYADVRHQVRVTIAGRVAEHVVLGSEHVRLGSAKSDLEKVTNICFDMFAYKGMSIDMESFEGSCANLAVELENNSPSNLFRIETMVQSYLNKQYKFVYEMLIKNRNILDLIIDRLMNHKMLDQQDLAEIWELSAMKIAA